MLVRLTTCKGFTNSFPKRSLITKDYKAPRPRRLAAHDVVTTDSRKQPIPTDRAPQPRRLSKSREDHPVVFFNSFGDIPRPWDFSSGYNSIFSQKLFLA